MIRKTGIWTLVISVLIIASSFTIEKASDEKFVVVKDNVVYLLNFNESFSSSTGSDGVKISYPYGCQQVQEVMDERLLIHMVGQQARGVMDERLHIRTVGLLIIQEEGNSPKSNKLKMAD